MLTPFSSHPIVICILCKLFNLILKFEYVPNAFGIGITIPLPKKDTKSTFDKLADYRGITISPIMSKIFELCMLDRLRNFLVTSDLQFGFKKGMGCNHALYCLRTTIDYFTSNNSTVNICSLDLAKAFDRVNHFSLFLKLMDRNCPRGFIMLLCNWYDKNYTLVKWGGCLSSRVKLTAGVRQGGVLSPHLFAILVDDVLLNLKRSSLGCRVRGLLLNAIMYADDLLLLSNSLTDLQAMVNLCTAGFSDIDLPININKSLCVRIGPNYRSQVANIYINNESLQWNTKFNYLGLNFLSGNSLKCNLQTVRQKYFRALNGIFGKIGTKSSAIVTLSLIRSFCVPILAYGIEALNVSRSMYNVLEAAYSAAFSKIFSTFDKEIIKQCQFYCEVLTFSDIIDLRRLNFLKGLKSANNSSINLLYYSQAKKELESLLVKHKLSFNESRKWKCNMLNNFASSLDGDT